MKSSVMQQGVNESFDAERYDIPADPARWIFEDGFIAGVLFAEEQRQAINEPSPQAVGTISQYPGATEEPEDEA